MYGLVNRAIEQRGTERQDPDVVIYSLVDAAARVLNGASHAVFAVSWDGAAQ